jgi:hypothetical protein
MPLRGLDPGGSIAATQLPILNNNRLSVDQAPNRDNIGIGATPSRWR